MSPDRCEFFDSVPLGDPLWKLSIHSVAPWYTGAGEDPSEGLPFQTLLLWSLAVRAAIGGVPFKAAQAP